MLYRDISMLWKETLEHTHGPFWPWEICALELQKNIFSLSWNMCSQAKNVIFP